MLLTVKYGDGRVMVWTFGYANEIDKLIAALVENIDPDWATIEVSIHTLGPKLAR